MKNAREIVETKLSVLNSVSSHLPPYIAETADAKKAQCLSAMQEIDQADADAAFRAVVNDLCVARGMNPAGHAVLYLSNLLNSGEVSTSADHQFINEVAKLVVDNGAPDNVSTIEFLRRTFVDLKNERDTRRTLLEKYESLQHQYAILKNDIDGDDEVDLIDGNDCRIYSSDPDLSPTCPGGECDSEIIAEVDKAKKWAKRACKQASIAAFFSALSLTAAVVAIVEILKAS